MAVQLGSGGQFDSKTSNGFAVATENGARNISVPSTVVGNVNTTLVTPASGNFLTLKGIVIYGEGNTGVAKLKRSSDDETLLPVYFSNFTKSNTTGTLNLELAVDESVYIETTGRVATDETFVGISYTEAEG